MSWMERLVRFFYGRNGMDKLNVGLMVFYLLLGVLTLFLRRNLILQILMLAVLLLLFFRAMSRNLAARQRENERFLIWWDRVSPFLTRQLRRLREVKTHRYRKCPHCRVILRLPRRTGKHAVRCPKCGETFQVHILF